MTPPRNQTSFCFHQIVPLCTFLYVFVKHYSKAHTDAPRNNSIHLKESALLLRIKKKFRMFSELWRLANVNIYDAYSLSTCLVRWLRFEEMTVSPWLIHSSLLVECSDCVTRWKATYSYETKHVAPWVDILSCC